MWQPAYHLRTSPALDLASLRTIGQALITCPSLWICFVTSDWTPAWHTCQRLKRIAATCSLLGGGTIETCPFDGIWTSGASTLSTVVGHPRPGIKIHLTEGLWGYINVQFSTRLCSHLSMSVFVWCLSLFIRYYPLPMLKLQKDWRNPVVWFPFIKQVSIPEHALSKEGCCKPSLHILLFSTGNGHFSKVLAPFSGLVLRS